MDFKDGFLFSVVEEQQEDIVSLLPGIEKETELPSEERLEDIILDLKLFGPKIEHTDWNWVIDRRNWMQNWARDFHIVPAYNWWRMNLVQAPPLSDLIQSQFELIAVSKDALYHSFWGQFVRFWICYKAIKEDRDFCFTITHVVDRIFKYFEAK